MSKFLNLVEDHKPDIDELTDAKRSLQRLLLKNKIEAHGKAFEDIIRVRLDDGRVVELEVKDVQYSEDQESFLSKNEKDVLAVTSDLVKDPRRRSFQTDPTKDLKRSYGDMIKKVAKKVKDVAKKIK
tara:strand:- start:46 stop:426 length:381 start_codon:yes stop_codon:yes gene_type:complete